MNFEEQFTMSISDLKVHKLRSVLTMLGIIFGVGAVIAMLSIGEGAKQEALEKYKFLCIDNIIVRDKNLTEQELEEVRAKFSRGLSVKDAELLFRSIGPGRLPLEILRRLQALMRVGLSYVNLDRPSPSLSRGEAQRARLAVCAQPVPVIDAVRGVRVLLDLGDHGSLEQGVDGAGGDTDRVSIGDWQPV